MKRIKNAVMFSILGFALLSSVPNLAHAECEQCTLINCAYPNQACSPCEDSDEWFCICNGQLIKIPTSICCQCT